MHILTSGHRDVCHGGFVLHTLLGLAFLVIAALPVASQTAPVMGVQRKEFTHKIAELNKFIKASPQNYVLYELRGKCLLDNKYEKEAMQDFNAAASLGSRNYMLYEYRGDLLLQHDKVKEAVTSYEVAIRLNPKNAGCWYLRAMACGMCSRYKDCIASCDEAIRLDPKSGTAYALRGYAHERLHERAEASADTLKARELGVPAHHLMSIY